MGWLAWCGGPCRLAVAVLVNVPGNGVYSPEIPKGGGSMDIVLGIAGVFCPEDPDGEAVDSMT